MQHPDAELCYLKIIRFLHLRQLPSKNNKTYSKKSTKTSVCLKDVISLMTMKMRLKMKNRSHRYDINRPTPRYGNKHTKYKM